MRVVQAATTDLTQGVRVEYRVIAGTLYRDWLTANSLQAPSDARKVRLNGNVVHRQLLCRHPGSYARCIEHAEDYRHGNDVPNSDLDQITFISLDEMRAVEARGF